MTALTWGRALSGWGAPQPLSQPQAPLCPAPARLQHHVLPGCLPRRPPYMYIYTTKPQNTRYIEIPTWGRPHTNSSRNPLWGGGVSLSPHTPPTTHQPLPGMQRQGQPGLGDPAGHSSDTAKRSRGQGWGELRQPRAPQPPQTQETSGEVPDRTNEQTNVRGTRQSKGDSRGPSFHPKPDPSPRWVAGVLGQAGTGRDEERGESGTPQALSTVAARTGHQPEGWPSQPEAPQLCVRMFLPCRSEGDGQKDLLPHSQPAWGTAWLPLGAGGSRCALKSPQAGISSSFILVGAGTGNPFLASSPRSQSFSCARLSSVMPWAASSARTLSR